MTQYWYPGNRTRCIAFFILFWGVLVWGFWGPLWGYIVPMVIAAKDAMMAVDDVANFKARYVLPTTITGLFLVWKFGVNHFLGRQPLRKPRVRVINMEANKKEAA